MSTQITRRNAIKSGVGASIALTTTRHVNTDAFFEYEFSIPVSKWAEVDPGESVWIRYNTDQSTLINSFFQTMKCKVDGDYSILDKLVHRPSESEQYMYESELSLWNPETFSEISREDIEFYVYTRRDGEEPPRTSHPNLNPNWFDETNIDDIQDSGFASVLQPKDNLRAFLADIFADGSGNNRSVFRSQNDETYIEYETSIDIEQAFSELPHPTRSRLSPFAP